MKALLLILTVTLALSANSQQFYSTTMFWNNLPFVNPATSGMENAHDFRTTFILPPLISDSRNITSLSNYNALYNRHHGIGVNYQYTRYFHNQYHKIQLNYNYQFHLSQTKKISIGISPGFRLSKSDIVWIPPTTAPDPFSPDNSMHNLNLNVGIAYKGNNIFAGLGITGLYQPRLDTGLAFEADHKSTYFAHFRYKWNVSRLFKLFFETYGKTNSNYSTAEVNVRTRFKDQYWLGITYRSSNVVAMNAGLDFKRKRGRNRYRIAYSIDFNKIKGKDGRFYQPQEFSVGFIVPHKFTSQLPPSFPLPNF
jgi:type IX secretion system PorP/SprF family membrane protein